MIPRSRLIRLPGVGHLAHEEAPERIAEIVRQAVG
jgi:pimeloyl-ACP methyl ester carboxylesterase